MGRREDDEVPPSLLPTYVSDSPARGRTRLRAPDGGDDAERETHPDLGSMPEEDAYAVTYMESAQIAVDATHSLAPSERRTRSERVARAEHAAGAIPPGGGTMSVTPHDAIEAAVPVSDTLVSLTDMEPQAVRSKRLVRGVLAVAVVALVFAVGALLVQPPQLPALPQPPAPVLVQAPLGLAQTELSFLSRRIGVPPPARDAALVTAPESPTATPRGRGPRTRTRETPALVARVPTPVASVARPPPPTTSGPDAKVSVVVRSRGEPVPAELWVDGQSKGQTPRRIDVRPGRHVFEARGPHGKVRQVIDIAPGSTEKVVLDLGTP